MGENGVLATCLTNPSGVGVLSGTLVCATDLGTRRILRPKILPGAPAALTSTQAAGTPNTSAVAARTVVGVTCGSRTRTLPASFMAKASTSVNIRIAAASAAVDAATTASAKAFAASTARGAAFSKTAPAAPLGPPAPAVPPALEPDQLSFDDGSMHTAEDDRVRQLEEGESEEEGLRGAGITYTVAELRTGVPDGEGNSLLMEYDPETFQYVIWKEHRGAGAHREVLRTIPKKFAPGPPRPRPRAALPPPRKLEIMADDEPEKA